MLTKSDQIKIIQKYYTDKWNCDSDVFQRDVNVIIPATDTFFEFITFGNNAVLRVDESIVDWCSTNLLPIKFDRIIGHDVLYKMLSEHDKLSVWHGTRYLYLHDNEVAKPDGFTYKLYNKDQLGEIPQDDKYRQALSFDGTDVIALAAYDGDTIVSIAGADDRMGDIWQIGINTLPEYRQCGLAVYLVKTLTDEIIKRGKLPFYNTWTSNIASTMVALTSGYRPVWVTYSS